MKSFLLLLFLISSCCLHGTTTKTAQSLSISYPSSSSSSLSWVPPEDVALIGTIRGELHALHTKTNEVLWTTNLGGATIKSYQSPHAIAVGGFVIPGEDGSLFTMMEGSLFQYPFSISDVVDRSPLFHDMSSGGGGMHTILGSKSQTLYRVDKRTGVLVDSLSMHSVERNEDEAAVLSSNHSFLVIRHEYRVRAFDEQRAEVWNLTYAKFSSFGRRLDSSNDDLSLMSKLERVFSSPVSILSYLNDSYIATTSSDLIEATLDPSPPRMLFKPKSACLNHFVSTEGTQQWYVSQKKYGQEANEDLALVAVFGNPLSTTTRYQRTLPVLPYAFGAFTSHQLHPPIDSLGTNQIASQVSPNSQTAVVLVLGTACILLLAFSFQRMWRLKPREDRIKIFSEKIKGFGANGTIVMEGQFENRRVAVKRMQRALHGNDSSALKEINFLIQSEGHPNVVRYFAREETNDFWFLALELCEMTLDQAMTKTDFSAMKSGRDWMTDSTRHFLFQLASATQHLHRLGIVHCDIKAQNILLVPVKSLLDQETNFWSHWTPKLSDMGLSRRVDTHSAMPSGLLGTTNWRAPELLLNSSFSRAVDVFSLGCLFFYILEQGRHPFGLENTESNIRNNHMVGLESVPMETFELIRAMVKFDPQTRLSIEACMHDALLWSSKDRLEFLCLVSNRLEREDPSSDLIKSFESQVSFENGGWLQLFPNPALRADVLSNKKRKYDLSSFRDLLRYIRNKHHHFQEDAELLQVFSEDNPEAFLKVFSTVPQLFPKIMSWVFNSSVVFEDKFLQLLGGLEVVRERSKYVVIEEKEEEPVAATSRAWFARKWAEKPLPPLPPPVPASNYKSMLCMHFQRSQTCAMGSKCGFAHGRIELRSNAPLTIPTREADLKDPFASLAKKKKDTSRNVKL